MANTIKKGSVNTTSTNTKNTTNKVVVFSKQNLAELIANYKSMNSFKADKDKICERYAINPDNWNTAKTEFKTALLQFVDAGKQAILEKLNFSAILSVVYNEIVAKLPEYGIFTDMIQKTYKNPFDFVRDWYAYKDNENNLLKKVYYGVKIDNVTYKVAKLQIAEFSRNSAISVLINSLNNLIKAGVKTAANLTTKYKNWSNTYKVDTITNVTYFDTEKAKFLPVVDSTVYNSVISSELAPFAEIDK